MPIKTKKISLQRTRINKDKDSKTTENVDYDYDINNLLDIIDLKLQLASKTSKLKENINSGLGILLENEIKYQNTFVIEKDKYNPKNINLEYDPLIEILKDLGLTPSSDTKSNHLFGIINKKYYEAKFLLLNDFQFIDDFKNKFSLYNNLKLCFPRHYNTYYPKTFLLNTNTYWNENFHNKIYIARPIGGGSGLDIVIVYNESTFNKAKKLIYEPHYKSGVSLTEYITNPMLIRGRKFHCRAYLMFTLFDNKFRAYLLDKGEIFILQRISIKMQIGQIKIFMIHILNHHIETI